MQGDIALSGVIGALSYALDITEGQPEGHALRSRAIGMRIAQELALPGAVRSDLFYTADRPYRGPLPEEKALDIVSREVPGRLDRTAFAALAAWLGHSTEPLADPLGPGVLTVSTAVPRVPGVPQNLSAAPQAPETRPVVPPSRASCV